MDEIEALLAPLPVPIPPNLEDALGYDGEARYVAFYWEPCGDEFMFDDGQYSTQGNWQVWLEYTNHQCVAPYLIEKCWRCRGVGTTNQLENEPCEICDGAGCLPLNFGYSDEVATHWFILDRETRKAYAAPVAIAQGFLRRRGPIVAQLTPEQMQAVTEAFQEAVKELNATWQPPSDEEIRASLERTRQFCDEIRAWLYEHGPYS
jgi:hypothetical protein